MCDRRYKECHQDAFMFEKMCLSYLFLPRFFLEHSQRECRQYEVGENDLAQ